MHVSQYVPAFTSILFWYCSIVSDLLESGIEIESSKVIINM